MLHVRGGGGGGGMHASTLSNSTMLSTIVASNRQANPGNMLHLVYNTTLLNTTR